MAIAKRVKQGGIIYQGKKITVDSASGDYPVAIVPSTRACAVNGVSVTPDSAGLDDYIDIAHVTTTATTGGVVVKQIATGIFNIGGGVTISLDFGAMQMLDAGHSIRVTYVNTASVAMPVYITVESIA
ncbi:hypothetical protein LCGC14_0619840 [marine sediment metagenome]|uniref:Uncharacterized protein n=1 Tax=marine sediment metagenome TaxID=412755 RepID=A0A0F9RPC9_9ZZZZ